VHSEDLRKKKANYKKFEVLFNINKNQNYTVYKNFYQLCEAVTAQSLSESNYSDKKT